MTSHPCQGCKYSVIRLKSPDGGHWLPKCKLYPSQVILKKCADFPLYSSKGKEN